MRLDLSQAHRRKSERQISWPPPVTRRTNQSITPQTAYIGDFSRAEHWHVESSELWRSSSADLSFDARDVRGTIA